MTRILMNVEFVVETCCHEKCGITWAVPKDFNLRRRDDHTFFYCPNGHSQHYPQKSQEEILKSQLKHCRISADSWRDEAKTMERSRRSLKGQITKMRKAISGTNHNSHESN